MLCYYFHPLGGGGVQRSAQFAAYLPPLGWEPVVVAAEPNARNRIEQGMDDTALRKLPADIRVERLASRELAALYTGLTRLRLRKALVELERLVPLLPMDYKIGWYGPALRAGRRLARERSASMIYSSSPPYSAHLAARRLKRELRLPWVADFRDPWTRSVEFRPPTPLHGWLERRLEGSVLEEADAVIANTPVNRQELVHAFGLAPDKVVVIPNGFDPADFEGAQPPLPDRFVVSCIGKFYDVAAVDAFFAAFRRFHEAHPDALLRLAGWLPRRVRAAVEREVPPSARELHDRVSHATAIRMMKTSALLVANVPDGADHWVPGKLYEYLAAQRPVLFVGPVDGAAAEVVRQAKAGEVVPLEESAVSHALGAAYDRWTAGLRDWSPDRGVVARYNRCTQTAQLAEVFGGVLRRSA